MKKIAQKVKPDKGTTGAIRKIDPAILKKKRIEQLKRMINNEEYLSEAVTKLAKSLTSGLMK
jgi:hypothetical protein